MRLATPAQQLQYLKRDTSTTTGLIFRHDAPLLPPTKAENSGLPVNAGHPPACHQGFIFFGPYAAPITDAENNPHTAEYLRILVNYIRHLRATAGTSGSGSNPTLDPILDPAYPDHTAFVRLAGRLPSKMLTTLRRAYIGTEFERLRWQAPAPGAAAGDTPAPRTASTVALTIARQLGCSTATVWSYIGKDFGSTMIPGTPKRAILPPPAMRLPRNTPEYEMKYQVLKAAFDHERSNRTAYRIKYMKNAQAGRQYTMRPPGRTISGCTVHNLKVTTAPNDGGYPTHCPVTGMELDWTPGCRVANAPRIAMRSEIFRTEAPADIKQDIMIVAKAAK